MLSEFGPVEIMHKNRSLNCIITNLQLLLASPYRQTEAFERKQASKVILRT
jgi:hypothetical protein